MTLETANRLFELRKKHNLSQEELAEKLGVSRQAVSKWERSEASPDTDNLIALAKIYNLSLDELIYGEKEEAGDHDQQTDKKTNEHTEEETEDKRLLIDIDDGKETVKIGSEGIFVESSDGEKVHISLKGITIKSSNPEDDEDDEDELDDEDDNTRVYQSGDGKVNIKINTAFPKINTAKFWLSVPYPIICTILYLWFGFSNICGGWALSWIVFCTIPVYYSLVEAISKRKFSEFSYSVLVSCIYLYLGLYHGNWHPSWLIFLTIPVYSPIASIIDSGIKRVK